MKEMVYTRGIKPRASGGRNDTEAGAVMNIEHMNERERYDVLVEMADLYYKQGKTQSEIARMYETNRFRVAKLLQDALNEHIVEIHIKYSTERNKAAEQALEQRYPLQKAIVVNTQYVSQMENLSQIGKVGAGYLARLLETESVIGVTWGKTIHSVVSQLPNAVMNTVHAVQLTGDPRLPNPNFDARELARTIAARMNGAYYDLNCPLYINSPVIRQEIRQEPTIAHTLDAAKNLGVVLTGIGGPSSLPLANPVVYPYLSDSDRIAAADCIGSIYGYTLDSRGQIADIDLNRKVISVPPETIRQAPHRLVVANGRHKVKVLCMALQAGLYNELLTDSDTAMRMLEQA